MNNGIILSGGPVFDGYELYENGAVHLKNGKIERIFNGPANLDSAEHIHSNGDLIMPGLVDLHSDSLERSIEKRKGVFFDVGFALLNLDRQLVSSGITSFCHAISFADNELGLRSPEEAEKCVRQIKDFQLSGQALVKHNTHIRYEVGSNKSFNVIKELIKDNLVDMVSIMDHTPGQGQFKSMESYMKFHSDEYDLSLEKILKKAKKKQFNNSRAWEMVSELAALVKSSGIPMLSHDDDTKDKINLIRTMGVGACEFPVTMEAARQARESGLDVFMGAPNLLRDVSTNSNLKASEALKKGCCTGLVSDYYPESLFQTPFIAEKYLPGFEQALQKVTSGPGSFLNQQDKPGRLEPGADADIIFVNHDHNWAHVTSAFVQGRNIFKIQ